MEILTVYLFLINALGLVLMLTDKRRAQKNLWRIPERTLFLSALLGGSLGILLGMRLFRHKTRKPAFCVGIPVLLAVHILLAVFCIIFINNV